MAELRDGKPYLSHLERTAAEPRDPGLHRVTLSRIDQINDNIRLLRLDSQHPVEFKAGQWLDVFVPDESVKKPGGFTVTSPPAFAVSPQTPFLELAIQHSPRNPPAAWLWRPSSEIVGKLLDVRLGGSFVFPPAHLPHLPAKVVMVAGGVGINPLVSMLSQLAHQHGTRWPSSVSLLYACKPAQDASEILFLSRLLELTPPLELRVFFGDTSSSALLPSMHGPAIYRRRMTLQDVKDVAPAVDACYYVCGPQKMTDEFVDGIRRFEGVAAENVLCEKWW